ncbi:hypothetical protein [Sphingopyxis sp. BSNA05]|nr:hypothetical protein [Sphingopyxis sp. BSNA05]
MEAAKKVECEHAMEGASTAEVCEALFASFDGDDLMDIITVIGKVIKQDA